MRWGSGIMENGESSGNSLEKGVFVWDVYHVFVRENGVNTVWIEIP
jgi:hypothetical protein